jgi:hypothetical protein
MIHLVDVSTKALLAYHKLYPNERPNVLFSFARLSRDLANLLFKHSDLRGSLILDSGTFSLHRNPRKFSKILTFPGYKAYLQGLHARFDFYFNFDKDYSKNGFDCNLAYQLDLEKAGYCPVPVVHDCYGNEVPYYIEKKYPLVAIGSGELEKAKVTHLYKIVDKFYSKGIKVHFLGCTKYEKLAKLPVFSADSSTWKHSGSGGPLLYWNPHKPGFDKSDGIWLRKPSSAKQMKKWIGCHPQKFEIQQYLETELGYTIEDFNKPRAHTKMLVANMHYYVQLEKRIAEEHRKRGFKFWV